MGWIRVAILAKQCQEPAIFWWFVPDIYIHVWLIWGIVYCRFTNIEPHATRCHKPLCHKPTIWGDGLYMSLPIYDNFLGMVYYWFDNMKYLDLLSRCFCWVQAWWWPSHHMGEPFFIGHAISTHGPLRSAYYSRGWNDQPDHMPLVHGASESHIIIFQW